MDIYFTVIFSVNFQYLDNFYGPLNIYLKMTNSAKYEM